MAEYAKLQNMPSGLKWTNFIRRFCSGPNASYSQTSAPHMVNNPEPKAQTIMHATPSTQLHKAQNSNLVVLAGQGGHLQPHKHTGHIF